LDAFFLTQLEPFFSDTEQRREKIEEHLSQIDERLRELEGEKDELNSFAELDSRRRALEYAIYHREDTEINDKLKEIEDDRLMEIQNVNEKNTQLADLEKAIRVRNIFHLVLMTPTLVSPVFLFFCFCFCLLVCLLRAGS